MCTNLIVILHSIRFAMEAETCMDVAKRIAHYSAFIRGLTILNYKPSPPPNTSQHQTLSDQPITISIYRCCCPVYVRSITPESYLSSIDSI